MKKNWLPTDRRTDGRTDGRTDRPTDGPMDSYRDASPEYGPDDFQVPTRALEICFVMSSTDFQGQG